MIWSLELYNHQLSILWVICLLYNCLQIIKTPKVVFGVIQDGDNVALQNYKAIVEVRRLLYRYLLRIVEGSSLGDDVVPCESTVGLLKVRSEEEMCK